MPYTANDRRFLYGLLHKHFSPNELATLTASALALEPGDFPQETRPAFCRALVLHHERRGRVRALVRAVLNSHPNDPLPKADRAALTDLHTRLADEAPLAPDLDPSADGAPGGVTLSAETLSVGGDVVGGDKVTIIQHLTALPDVPTDYGPRIKNFLHEYLGDSKQRVPFGGRERELAALDSWLADSEAPPYALLTAEAGRGKSALLVQWATQLEAWGEAEAIFVPVSIRFNTALASVVFTALAARLGEVYGEPIKWADLSADQWRGVCQSYLSRTPPDGKQVVVILDGLDEAADWQAGADLFPRVPPAGVRVVVSARFLAGDTDERGWRRRLGWEQERLAQSIPLPLLTREGVQVVLAAMGNPLGTLATRVDVVGELFRLSEGDPLLVRLYVEALLPYGEQVALLAPNDLQRVTPGLAGYFDRWWQEQRRLWGGASPLKERAVHTTLTLLSGALGPLDAETLLSLIPAEVGLDSLLLEEALLPLARFIVGDGQQTGYAFSHPRLGYYFWEKRTPRERVEWERRFLAFGDQVLTTLNQGTLAPPDAPPYAVQYYGAHLERAKAPDAALYALISEGWMGAWEALEGTHAGFLNDVARAWQRANRALAAGHEVDEALVQQVRAALCWASVAALSANTPADLLALAVQNGSLTSIQAIVLVAQVPNDSQRAEMLIVLAPHLPQALLTHLLDLTNTIRDERQRADTLTKLAPHLSADNLRVVLDAACAIQEESTLANTLAGLAPHLNEDNLCIALGTACALQEEWWRARALQGLAPHLSENNLLVALGAACALQDALRRIDTLTTYSLYLSGMAQRYALSYAINTALAIEDKPWQAISLVRLAPYLGADDQRHMLAYMLDIVQTISDEKIRVVLLMKLAPYLSADDQNQVLTGALASVQAIWMEWLSWSPSLTQLAPHLSLDNLPVALDTACAIQDEEDRGNALAGLAPHLNEDNLRVALDAACAIQDAKGRSNALTGLAPHLNEDNLRVALGAARTVQDAEGRANALVGLAPHLSVNNLRVALVVARAIQDEEMRGNALAGLAPHLNEDNLHIALDAACAIQNAQGRANALVGLAPHLSANNLRIALVAARAIQDEEIHAATLTGLAPYLNEDNRRIALDAACDIQSDWGRADALSGLAPYLSSDNLRIALVAARSLWFKGNRVRVLTALASCLSGVVQEQALTDALAAARMIQDEEQRLTALTELAPYLNEDSLHVALDAARVTQHEEARAAALAGLAPYLNEDNLHIALDAARATQNEEARAAALAGLAPYLNEDNLHIALDAARAIRNERFRAAALAALVPHFRGVTWCRVLGDALAAAYAIRNERFRAAALTNLVPHFNNTSHRRGLVDTLVALTGSALYLRGTSQGQVLVRTLTAVYAIQDEGNRSEALIALAPYLNRKSLHGTLAVAYAIRDDESRTKALSGLVPYLSVDARAQILADTLSLAHAIQEDGKMTALTRLSSYLPEADRALVLSLSAGVATDRHAALPHWSTTLRVLAPRLAVADLRAALDAARTIRNEWSRVAALTALAPYLSGNEQRHVLTETLDATRAIQSEGSRVAALTALAPYLSGNEQRHVLTETLDATRAIQSEGSRVAALTALAPYLSGNEQPHVLTETLDAACAIQSEGSRAAALTGLAPHLATWAATDRAAALPHWTATLHALAHHPRPAFLVDLTALLPFALALAGDEKEQVAEGIAQAIHEVCSWWP